MMLIVRHLIEALLNPFFSLFLLSVLAVLGLFCIKRKEFAYGGLFVVFVFALIASTGFLPRYLTHKLEGKYPPIVRVNENIKWIVVLGGGQAQYATGSAENVLSQVSLRRLFHALRLYRRLFPATLLLSGGEQKGRTPEAMQLADVIQLMGVAQSDFLLESSSKNTLEQIQAIQPVLKKNPFYLVTSAIHMPRAMALCQKFGLNAIAAPTDFTFFWDDERWEKMWLPNANNLVYFSIAEHELLGQFWARLQGKI